jgi:drug/metabolite transporter superfamily protein YnfA
MKAYKKTCTILFVLMAIYFFLGALAGIGCYFVYNWSETVKNFLMGGIEYLVMVVACFLGVFLVRRKAKGVIASLIIAAGVILFEIVDYLTTASSERGLGDQIEVGLVCAFSLVLLYFVFQRLKAVRAEVDQKTIAGSH